MVEHYDVQGEVTVAVQAIEELLLCTVVDFGGSVIRIKRLSQDTISFSMKVSVAPAQLPALYHHLREQVNLQLGEDVLDYLQLIAK
ncbi:hypothetical protein D3D03_07010 [Exiguobacterium sp. RIT452]|uniref:hypothetical protein n=1 Tax=Exiguobacterium TaxID=33986 RepID=UPI000E70A3A9|nr:MULTISPECIES: hypothetical protein [unclassified Exiguobacterium]RJP00535.1 hypothetical protein D3D03_07010 [Exiguobacterium sp. RIT452]